MLWLGPQSREWMKYFLLAMSWGMCHVWRNLPTHQFISLTHPTIIGSDILCKSNLWNFTFQQNLGIRSIWIHIGGNWATASLFITHSLKFKFCHFWCDTRHQMCWYICVTIQGWWSTDLRDCTVKIKKLKVYWPITVTTPVSQRPSGDGKCLPKMYPDNGRACHWPHR